MHVNNRWVGARGNCWHQGEAGQKEQPHHGKAEDNGKQLLAKPATPKLNAEATRHPRVPKGLAEAHPLQLLLGREEGTSEDPDPPSHRWV